MKNISTEREEIMGAVLRLYECGGAVDYNSAGEVFDTSEIIGIMRAIEEGLIESSLRRLWISPGLMLKLMGVYS